MSQHEPEKPPPQRLRWTAGSIALFVIGLLILVPSGLCTGIFGAIALSDISRETAGLLAMALMIGGIPALIGAALVYAGLKARRRD
jgi:hypothetical protein